MSALSGVAGCVNLSVQIISLLLTSKENKHEYRSLQSAVQNIKVFLTAMPQEGITQQGNEVLSKYQQQQQLLVHRIQCIDHPKSRLWGCGAASCACDTRQLGPEATCTAMLLHTICLMHGASRPSACDKALAIMH
jgi:hypothetical protein